MQPVELLLGGDDKGRAAVLFGIPPILGYTDHA